MAKDSPGRIPTLDGLRAVAIGLVLIAHTLGTGDIPESRPIEKFGEIGVRIFFVLSGFLITTLLAREHAKTGTISLRAFFVRRVYRIFPAFFAFVGIMAILAATDVITLPGQELLWAATYTMNFHTPATWWVGHLWSLAVEEQFYLVWPATVVLVGFARVDRIAIAAVILAPIFRVAAQVWIPWIDDAADHAFPFVFDGLAIGCLLALWRERLEASPRYMAFLSARWFWLVPINGLFAMWLVLPHWGPMGDPKLIGLAQSFNTITIALAVHRCVARPTSIVGRVLETAPLVWLGTLSYSLYLWQQPFLNRLVPAWYTRFPLSYVFAFVCACASYYLIERPILRWRARTAHK